MTMILHQLRPAILLTLALTAALGLLYPLTVTGLAQLLMPHQANGSLVQNGSGAVIGSALIGQQFSAPGYFHGRPSATVDAETGADRPYNAANSTASNLGPTNQKLIDAVAERAAAYRALNGLAADALVPVDAVTTSGSGLDPHISPANARLQVERVARVRAAAPSDILALVERHTEGRMLGLLGEPRVNVLSLNLALDVQDGAR